MADTGALKELNSYPMNEMILSLAKGIAEAQYEMDRISLKVLKERSEEAISNDADAPSLLQLGLFPAFFTLDQTTIEISIQISMYEGDTTSFSLGADLSAGVDRSNDNASGGGSKSSSVMFGASVSLEKSRKYGMDMSGATRVSSLILSHAPPKKLLELFNVEVDED